MRLFNKFFASDDELLRKPGSKYDYCSYAFVLLSAVLETVIDKPFHEYIHDFVRQLGMKHTMPEPTPKSREIVLDRLPCYFFNAKTVSLTLVPEVTLLHRTAGGGLISSLSDLCLLGSLIAQQFAGVRNGLPGVKNELFNQILRPPQGTEARVPGLPKKNYSLGFQVYEEDPSFPEGDVFCSNAILLFQCTLTLAKLRDHFPWLRGVLVRFNCRPQLAIMRPYCESLENLNCIGVLSFYDSKRCRLMVICFVIGDICRVSAVFVNFISF